MSKGNVKTENMTPALSEKLKEVAIFMGADVSRISPVTLKPYDDRCWLDDTIYFYDEKPRSGYLLAYNTDYNELMKVWVKFRDYAPAIIFGNLNNRNRKEAFDAVIVSEIVNNDTPESAFDSLYAGITFLNSLKQDEK